MSDQANVTETPELDITDNQGKTVEFTADQVILMRTLLKYALQDAARNVATSPNPREALKKAQNVADLEDLFM